ncbi:basic helix-loop-helix (bHLH) DNA-bindingsuperfamily protein [Striga asiatica]|uniref:Basic helix-loop-helix (BHLH) DNA-bindingsuperfamily protein n=1 Tax=Striga asiatica TaxID=4170 RepID=A0A5A7PUB3_STRAF|nr:basic helix-loop-helix (bHLH) DNA-bindingsuperfamily protein [Striga asiatica]
MSLYHSITHLFYAACYSFKPFTFPNFLLSFKSLKIEKNHTQMNPNHCYSKPDRKIIEKERRNVMKSLYSSLNSLVPNQSSRENFSIPGQLEGATNYIKKLQFNLEKLKQQKECLLRKDSANLSVWGGIDLPSIDVCVMGSALEVFLISGKNYQFKLSEIIRILHEEGAEVVSASFSVLDDAFLHTMHCKVDYGVSSQDDAAARLRDRLRNFVSIFR